jgi:hypothetical protein
MIEDKAKEWARARAPLGAPAIGYAGSHDIGIWSDIGQWMGCVPLAWEEAFRALFDVKVIYGQPRMVRPKPEARTLPLFKE